MIKENKKTRCPWCGEIYRKKGMYSTGKYDFIRKCMNCNNYSAPTNELIGFLDRFIVLIFLIPLLVYFKDIKLNNIVIYSIVFFTIYIIFIVLFINNVPYKRIRNIKEKKREDLQEKRLLDAKIKWNCSKRRIFKLWNNKLLIIISIDKAGTAVSQPLCVRIRKSKECYVLTKINESKEFDVNKCKRFYVYWGEEKVGEGET